MINIKAGLFQTNQFGVHADGHKLLDSAYIFVGGLAYELTEGDVITIFSQYVIISSEVYGPQLISLGLDGARLPMSTYPEIR